jgi:hypothetical protein
VSLRVRPSSLPQVRSEHHENGDGEVPPTTLAHQRWDTYDMVLTHVIFCVEIPDGISGSESDEGIADNPKAA